MCLAEANLTKLRELKIDYILAEHEPVFTLEAMLPAVADKVAPEDLVVKNLYLKEKKGGTYLYTVDGLTAVDLKGLQKKLEVRCVVQSRRDSSGNPDFESVSALIAFDCSAVSSFLPLLTYALHRKSCLHRS